ncbi:MAG: spore germination protein [Lachnospiraceae bacterium]|nr:spore germination protein [Lachnospiraceae bacterium]
MKNHADALIFRMAICAEASQICLDATPEIADATFWCAIPSLRFGMEKCMVVSGDLNKDMQSFDSFIVGCDDIKTMKCDDEKGLKSCIYYMEVTINTTSFDGMIVEQEFESIEEAVTALMAGNAIRFIHGHNKAQKILSVGYPMMTIGESRNEKVLRGSREGFADSVKTNTALVRRRMKNNSLRVTEKILGEKSKTMVHVLYVDGITRKSVLDEAIRRLDNIDFDGICDSGIIEQLTEERTSSPFPQYQTTERPDKAVMELLSGRVVILVDNTPVALLLPTNYSSFFKTVDDYYNRYAIASFARIIRYIAAFLAISLPAIYLAVVNFNPEVLPTPLLLAFYEARQSVPFPALIEVLLMELSFELLREAGIRIPGPVGSTISIVGGLIIGQAAVTAKLVSPIIVIVVAVTALASFAVPNEELTGTFRLLKYFQILLTSVFGLFGIIISWLLIISHLSRMKSFNFPYLMPISSDDVNNDNDKMDFIIRFPLKQLKKKKIYEKQKGR